MVAPELVQLVQGLTQVSMPNDNRKRYVPAAGAYQHYVATFEELYGKAAEVMDSFNARISACATQSGGQAKLAALKAKKRSVMKAITQT